MLHTIVLMQWANIHKPVVIANLLFQRGKLTVDLQLHGIVEFKIDSKLVLYTSSSISFDMFTTKHKGELCLSTFSNTEGRKLEGLVSCVYDRQQTQTCINCSFFSIIAN